MECQGKSNLKDRVGTNGMTITMMQFRLKTWAIVFGRMLNGGVGAGRGLGAGF